MKSSMMKSAVAALALCSNAVLGALTAEQIVDNINTLALKSQDLQEPATSITAVNGPLLAVGQGPIPQVINGFRDIIQTATDDFSDMKGTAAITEAADQDSIYDAFRDFVRAHQEVLNTLTGKAALFSTVPFIGQPLAAVLRQDESVLDTLTFSLIDLIQSRAADIDSQGQNLSKTVATCIDAYSGL
ncbi:hypothetical protein PFICI_13218 [Pestalotiopsis fici W106-1]|uniref:Uncharacterized protein n=1 Tax=Pestalotiopsis fici (strain W106-1 / CGMCC3.15140) TaxID=1229662 RepID=W3WLW0_PESFW|nr:uncharacterized protein PFICI_13218 [Pestalotiopsis fici W106-1]ETS74734.1 hypothetical protein PFICI_13218 [Pestalotiopsis fici W106-1]